MRIIAGEFKSRPIVAPKGLTARPTADRVREAVFNVLENGLGVAFDGARVIDLFAGSGALGLEALSRGAAFALFVETDAGSRGAIRDNIEALGLFGSTRIHRRDATKLGPKPAGLGAPFDLAFLDAPYRKGLSEPALGALADGAWLAPDALVVVETSRDEAAPDLAAFETIETREHGDTMVSILCFSSD